MKPAEHLDLFESEVTTRLSKIGGVSRVLVSREELSDTATVVQFFSDGHRYGIGVYASSIIPQYGGQCACDLMLLKLEQSVRLTLANALLLVKAEGVANL